MQTFANTAPSILTRFNPYLLLDFLGRSRMRLQEVKIIAHKKIRLQDIGKKRAFVMGLIQYEEYYERAKIKKEKYEAAIEKLKKRPYISNTGATCKFTRFQPKIRKFNDGNNDGY